MNKNKRKISVVTLLLTLVLAFAFSFVGIIPQGSIKAEAKGNEKISIYTVPKDDGGTYWKPKNAIWLVKNGKISKAKKKAFKAIGITYDPKKNTLTLKNCVQPDIELRCLFVGTDFKINSQGVNELLEIGCSGLPKNGYICKPCNVTMGGKGELILHRNGDTPQNEVQRKHPYTGDFCGICVDGGRDNTKLTIKKSFKLTVYGNIRVDCVDPAGTKYPKKHYKKLLVFKGNKTKVSEYSGGDSISTDYIAYTSSWFYTNR